MHTVRSKVDKIVAWPVPKNNKEMSSFLGMAGYYRKFIQNYAKISKLLVALTGKYVEFVWGSQQEEAFQTLKSKLAEAPVLAPFRDGYRTRVYTDASLFAVGAVLTQQQDDNKWRPVAYFSHCLTKSEQNYCVTGENCLRMCLVYSTSKYICMVSILSCALILGP